ncbi:hypothetical protein Tco_0134686 [Tanacetum coccineum]
MMIIHVANLNDDNPCSDAAPSAAATTTALSTTFASAITIPPISVDDYVVADVVNEENVQPNVEYKGEVRGSSLPLRSFNLYDPYPSASVTSYGPSHLGPNFPVSSTRLASLLRYTKSPGLKLAFLTLVL